MNRLAFEMDGKEGGKSRVAVRAGRPIERSLLGAEAKVGRNQERESKVYM